MMKALKFSGKKGNKKGVNFMSNSIQKIERGLHPDSSVNFCDVCGTLVHAETRSKELKQYGRFVAHVACKDRNQDLESLKQQPLDYSPFNKPGLLPYQVISQMKAHLEIELLDRLQDLASMIDVLDEAEPFRCDRITKRNRLVATSGSL